ncbi:MAG: hypothetical protein ACI379_10730 [Nocardioides sp.]|uniref:hypothetical protein n=1 Tax=Nocardioides sp. TaxID=35761 RepID=UPI003F0229F9
MFRGRRERREKRMAELDVLRLVRRAADEDVTLFGEELSELHFETLTTQLGPRAVGDYQAALDAYESAKSALAAAAEVADVSEVTRLLADGRFAQACVLAERDGTERPTRRPPCFFDPSHGPASRDVEWAPPGGVAREIPVCFRDAQRLAAGERPDVRLVRVGDRRVAWFDSGPAYAAWASGWYDQLVREGRVEVDRLTMWSARTAATAGAAAPLVWSDPGAWSGGGLHGVGDHGACTGPTTADTTGVTTAEGTVVTTGEGSAATGATAERVSSGSSGPARVA